MNYKVLASFFTITLIAFAGSKLEAKHNSHFRMNVNTGYASPSYIVQPAPIVVQQPVYVQSAPIVTYSQYYGTPTYVAPTYVVQPQPIIVQQPRQKTSFNWGFANWGFSIQL
jgi:hypothetical protein